MTANIRHSTENNEFATPLWLVEKARYVLGGIDLDPASSHLVNREIGASKIFTLTENGLLQPCWNGRVFLNCPGGLVDGLGRNVYRKTKLRHGCDRTGACGLPPGHSHEGVCSSQVVWWRALCKQWQLGHVTSAFFVGFSLELLQSCQDVEDHDAVPHPLDFPYCIPKKRIKFDLITPSGERVSGTQPTHSNVLVLLPPDHAPEWHAALARFAESMSGVGRVWGVR